MSPFGVHAEDVYFHPRGCSSRVLRLVPPHGSRAESDPPAAIPELPRARLDWRDGKQLWLWSYTVTGLQLDEDGQTCHPELPADYPLRRPKRFAYCEAIGLGEIVPCAFATCRHNLLSDEYKGEVRPDVDPWEVETCALVVARRRVHSKVEVSKITGHCESVTEEWLRRSVKAVKQQLGLQDFQAPAVNHGHKPDTDCSGLAELVAKMPERPKLNMPPVKILTKEQVAALYGRRMVSPSYGQTRP
jgi:hypothetical protein